MLTRLTIMDLEPSRHRLFISMLFDLLFFDLLHGRLCCNRGRRRSQILAKFVQSACVCFGCVEQRTSSMGYPIVSYQLTYHAVPPSRHTPDALMVDSVFG